MKFPGFSIEGNLNMYFEEFTGFDPLRDTLFVEIRKIKTMWLYDYDP